VGRCANQETNILLIRWDAASLLKIASRPISEPTFLDVLEGKSSAVGVGHSAARARSRGPRKDWTTETGDASGLVALSTANATHKIKFCGRDCRDKIRRGRLPSRIS